MLGSHEFVVSRPRFNCKDQLIFLTWCCTVLTRRCVKYLQSTLTDKVSCTVSVLAIYEKPTKLLLLFGLGLFEMTIFNISSLFYQNQNQFFLLFFFFKSIALSSFLFICIFIFITSPSNLSLFLLIFLLFSCYLYFF